MTAISWETGISGNWSTASNWSGGTVPNYEDDVTINATGTYTVTVDGQDSVASLTLDAPSATISIPSGDYLLSTASSISGGEIDGPGTLYTYAGGVWSITSGTPLTLGGGLTWSI
jgi:hypothetical protein